eukprot:2105632-Rhodomonas_salina.1
MALCVCASSRSATQAQGSVQVHRSSVQRGVCIAARAGVHSQRCVCGRSVHHHHECAWEECVRVWKECAWEERGRGSVRLAAAPHPPSLHSHSPYPASVQMALYHHTLAQYKWPCTTIP